MRRLMWFAIGFAAATAGAVYLQLPRWLLLVATFLALLAIGMKFVPGKLCKRISLISLGLCVALCWVFGMDRLYLSGARGYDEAIVDTTITVTDYSYPTVMGIGADGVLGLDNRSYKVRFYMDTTDPLKPGDVVTGTFRLRFTAYGGSEEPTYHGAEGIYLLAYPEENVRLSEPVADSFRTFPARLRKTILDTVGAVFPEDTRSFAKALLLGDTAELSYKEDTAYRVSGIRHVVATSGLHISILFSAIYILLGKRPALTALLGIPVLILFSALAGFTPSVVRACVMQILMLLALIVNKEYDPPTALSFAVVLILLINPISVTSVSLQLSVGCVAGIFLFSGRISGYLLHKDRLGPAKGKGWKAKLTRWFVGSVSVSLSSMVFTTPLCGVYFGAISIIGVVTNLLTLWMIPFVFCGIGISVIAGLTWPAGAAVIAWVVSWAIRLIQGIAAVLAKIPMAAVYTSSVYIVLWVAFCYCLFSVMLLSKKKKPLLACGCMAVGLIVALSASWLEPRLDEGRMYTVDVGQGQCIILQRKDAVYMVDCGGDKDALAADAAAQTLLSYGISSLDGLIVTHYDADHAGGVPYLLSRIPVEKVYLPAAEDEAGLRAEIEAAAGSSCVYAENAILLEDTGWTLGIYPPEIARTSNETSLCVLFQTKNCDILITGDRNTYGEKELLDKSNIPDLDILVAGHHGSENSTGMEILYKTRPETVVLSVGEDNYYGHPHRQTLMRLSLFNCRVLRTDREGTIILRW